MARFVQYEDQELANFCEKKNAKNTDRGTRSGIKLLRSFFKETRGEGTVEELAEEELNTLLVKFYAGVRTAKGELYKLNSMRSLRFNISKILPSNHWQ